MSGKAPVAELHVADAEAMRLLGARLANCIQPPASIWLSGDLGTGKTTLAQGFIAALGHRGRVKSPTYTLVESYSAAGFDVHHFDFYRITGDEIENIGVRDYFRDDAVCLIEWPQRADARLPAPTLRVAIEFAESGRRVRLHR